MADQLAAATVDEAQLQSIYLLACASFWCYVGVVFEGEPTLPNST
jgi:hypothetical protein